LKKILKNALDVWVQNAVFSLTLFIIVWLSEVFLRSIYDVAPNPYSYQSVLYLFFMVLIFAPIVLILFRQINPVVTNRIFGSYGFKKKSVEDDDAKSPPRSQKLNWKSLIKKLRS
jgi:Mg2+/Co2+ transporter CorB